MAIPEVDTEALAEADAADRQAKRVARGQVVEVTGDEAEFEYENPDGTWTQDPTAEEAAAEPKKSTRATKKKVT